MHQNKSSKMKLPMKGFHCAVLYLLTLFLPFQSNAQEWISNFEAGGNVLPNSGMGSLHFTDLDHGWAISSGSLLSTKNGGLNWTIIHEFQDFRIVDIHFVDNHKGWAVGEAFISGEPNKMTFWTTENGGKDWIQQDSGQTGELKSVYFIDENTGFSVGRDGIVMKTSDGGENWSKQTLETSNDFLSVHFTDAMTGWTVGWDGTIVNTTDGGETWTTQVSGTSTRLLDVEFRDENTGWAVGNDGTILKTGDGGETWFSQTSGVAGRLLSIYIVDDNSVWVSGDHGVLLSSDDKGETWTIIDTGSSNGLTSVFFTDKNTGYIGGGAYMTTTDGGKSWTKIASGKGSFLNQIHFADEKHGWAVQRNYFLGSNDGGLNWEIQDIEDNIQNSEGLVLDVVFNNVHSVDKNNAWGTTGWPGILVTTSDGGKTWRPGHTPAPFRINSVYFVDKNTGWLATILGGIFKTENAGSKWHKQNSGTTSNLNAIYFADKETGYAIGESGTILATKIGGTNWTPQNSGTTANLTALHFIDAEKGWVVGNNGTILHTNDGGETWIHQNSGTSNHLNSIYFTDAFNGWASSEKKIFATQDGGETWTVDFVILSCCANRIESLHFTDENTGFSTGRGVLMYITSSCDHSELSLTSAAGSDTQKVYIENPIENITYRLDGDAEGVEVRGLPEGVSGTFDGIEFTISGSPLEVGTFNYTVSTTGTPMKCHEDVARGTIEVEGRSIEPDSQGTLVQLAQNVPNPFEQETTIGFNLPEKTTVTLRIIDINGNEVISTEGEYDAGYNEIPLRLNISPGIYYYQLITPYGRVSKRMIAH